MRRGLFSDLFLPGLDFTVHEMPRVEFQTALPNDRTVEIKH